MSNMNYTFFEEYKKLQNLCNDMYSSHNGVTNYIDDMRAVPHAKSQSVPHWESDLKQLRRLRHIRNTLAHEQGAFHQNICTLDDIHSVQTFYNRICKQTDPLAVLYRSQKPTGNKILPRTKMPPRGENRRLPKPYLTVILCVAIMLLAYLAVLISFLMF